MVSVTYMMTDLSVKKINTNCATDTGHYAERGAAAGNKTLFIDKALCLSIFLFFEESA